MKSKRLIFPTTVEIGRTPKGGVGMNLKEIRERHEDTCMVEEEIGAFLSKLESEAG